MAGLCYSGLISYVTQPNIANICCLGCTVSKKENGKNNLNVPIFPRLLSAAGGGSGGVIIHVNTADHMTVSSSSNCNLQTGSAQQQGKRVRGEGEGRRGRGGGGSLFACKYGTMRLYSAQILFLAFTHVCMHV